MFLALVKLLHGSEFWVQELLQEIIFASVRCEYPIIQVKLFFCSQTSISRIVKCGLETVCQQYETG